MLGHNFFLMLGDINCRYNYFCTIGKLSWLFFLQTTAGTLVHDQARNSVLLVGGGRPKRVGKKHTRRLPNLDICQLWTQLRIADNSASLSHYHADGIYGRMASSLQWTNNASNRYALKKRILSLHTTHSDLFPSVNLNNDDFTLPDTQPYSASQLSGNLPGDINVNIDNSTLQGIQTYSQSSSNLPGDTEPNSTHPSTCSDHSHITRAHHDNKASAVTNCALSPSTMCKILGPGSNEEFFVLSLSQNHTFHVLERDWFALCKCVTKRQFKRGTWQEYFITGIKESNKFCVFSFRRHTLSICKLRHRKNNSLLFSASGRCTFPDCPVTVTLKIRKLPVVEVTYTGNILHRVSDMKARNISGHERQVLKETFKRGERPLNEYIHKLGEKSSDELVAGNFDGMGTNVNVFRKISSESKHVNSNGSDWVKNVSELKEHLQNEDKSSSLIKGFVHDFSVSPLTLHFFSESGIRIWHELCKTSVVFFDATGTVVEKSKNNSKEILYYELVFQNKLGGSSCIPVAGFLSDNQSEVAITHFLHNIQHAEKRLYGHSKKSQPKQVNVDNSMAIIVSVLKAFNLESLDDYLNRCWRITSGAADTNDFCKTVIHICLSHFMNAMKHKLLKVYKKNFTFGMHCLGLLANCSDLVSFRQLVIDFLLLLRSDKLSTTVIASHNRLVQCINTFNSSLTVLSSVMNDGEPTDVSDYDIVNSNTTNLPEAECLVVHSKSKFKSFCESIALEVEQLCKENTVQNDNDIEEVNDKKCDDLANYLVKHYITIFPLWSAIMLGDLKRHNHIDHTNICTTTITSNDSDRTNSIIEKRFSTLKNVTLHVSHRSRLDDFSVSLYKDHLGFQKLAAVNLLKRKRSIKGFDETLLNEEPSLLNESWNKKLRNSATSSKLPVGKYQQAPKRSFSSLKVLKSDNDDSPISSKSVDTVSYAVGLGETPDKAVGEPSVTQESKSSRAPDTTILKPCGEQSRTSLRNSICTRKGNEQSLNEPSLPKSSAAPDTAIYHPFAKQTRNDTSSIHCNSTIKLNKQSSSVQPYVASVHSYENLHCPMVNFASNCWFNATMQALCYTEMITRFLESEVLPCWTDIRNLFRHLRSGRISNLSNSCSSALITKAFAVQLPGDNHPAITKHSSDRCNLSPTCDEEHGPRISHIFTPRLQHDCHEFITQVLKYIFSPLSNEINTAEMVICNKCGFTNETLAMYHVLSVDVPNQPSSVSVQTLLNNYFQDRNLIGCRCELCGEKCCKQKVSIKQMPYTLIILLQRIQCCEKKSNKTKKSQFTQIKNLTPVIPDLYIHCCQSRFKLRSMIIHSGNTSTGHYTASVLHSDGEHVFQVDCDDKSVTCSLYENNEFYNQNCYMLVYDAVKYSDNLFSSAVTVLQAVSKTKSMHAQKLMYSLQTQYDFRKWQILQLCSFDYSVAEAAILLCQKLCSDRVSFLFKDLIIHIVSYLFSQDDYISLFTGKIIISGTCPCCRSSKSICAKKDFNSYICKAIDDPFDTIKQYFLHNTVTPCCGLDFDNCDIAFVSLPLNIALYVQNSDILPDEFEAKFGDIQLVYSGDVAYYKVKESLVFEESEHVVKLAKGNITCRQCFLILELVHIKHSPTLLTTNSSVANIPLKYLQPAEAKRQLRKSKCDESVSSLLNIVNGGNKNNLFNSSVIDMYFNLLSRVHYSSVHSVCCSWVGQRLFRSTAVPLDFIAFFENRQVLWFEQDYVLIPVNVDNSHWILYVLAVCEEKLYFCDSLNKSYPQYDCQILRYIAIEYYRKFHCVINYSSLPLCRYCSSSDFILQADSHSCGAYVCMMAKAIIFSRKFQFEPDLARDTIAVELCSSTLTGVPNTILEKIQSCAFSHMPILNITDVLSIDYQNLLDEELCNTVIAFSHEDANILRDNHMVHDKIVTVMSYSKHAHTVPDLNEDGILFRNETDPNLFNFLIEIDIIHRRFVSTQHDDVL
jgi:hypothetical protein